MRAFTKLWGLVLSSPLVKMIQIRFIPYAGGENICRAPANILATMDYRHVLRWRALPSSCIAQLEADCGGAKSCVPLLAPGRLAGDDGAVYSLASAGSPAAAGRSSSQPRVSNASNSPSASASDSASCASPSLSWTSAWHGACSASISALCCDAASSGCDSSSSSSSSSRGAYEAGVAAGVPA